MSCPPALAAASFFKSAQGNDSITPSSVEYLTSWEEGDNKQAIIDFVEGAAQDIPPEDRIAVFDNDGTLWSERPNYFQFDYLLSKASGSMKQNLESLKDDQLSEVIGSLPIFSSMSVEDYRADVLDFLETTTQQDNSGELGGYSSFGVPYMELIYQPMIELVQYLQDRGFSVFICSGGGMDFVRAFSEEAYGIPRQNVIGSVAINSYDRDNREVIHSSGTPVSESSLDMRSSDSSDYLDGGYPTPSESIKPFVINPFNDKEGKAIGIERYLGKKPIMAVGNSDGDFFMFDYTDSNTDEHLGNDKPLIVLLNHDAECPVGGFNPDRNDCEYTYNSDITIAENGDDDRQDFCDDLEYCSLNVAEGKENWQVVSMANDFNRIFPWGNR